MFKINATCAFGAMGIKLYQNPFKNAMQNAGHQPGACAKLLILDEEDHERMEVIFRGIGLACFKSEAAYLITGGNVA